MGESSHRRLSAKGHHSHYMSLRTETCYLTRQTRRDADVAATLIGLDCGDAMVELICRNFLDAIPELQERGKAIKAAVGREVKAWQEKYPASAASASGHALRAIREARQ